MSPVATVDEVRAAFLAELDRTRTPDDLQELRHRYLGRKRGAVTALLKSVAQAPPETRRDLGRRANTLKQEIERALGERSVILAFKNPQYPRGERSVGGIAQDTGQARVFVQEFLDQQVQSGVAQPIPTRKAGTGSRPLPDSGSCRRWRMRRKTASTSRCPAARSRSGTGIR